MGNTANINTSIGQWQMPTLETNKLLPEWWLSSAKFKYKPDYKQIITAERGNILTNEST